MASTRSLMCGGGVGQTSGPRNVAKSLIGRENSQFETHTSFGKESHPLRHINSIRFEYLLLPFGPLVLRNSAQERDTTGLSSVKEHQHQGRAFSRCRTP